MDDKNYNTYCDFHASKCKKCLGQKSLLVGDIFVTCSCQFHASIKWRFDQIQIYPESLKFKTWNDFNGIDGAKYIVEASCILNAKSKAMEYCFGLTDTELTKNRKKNSVIHKRLSEGRNFIINGETGTGKSLLALLILKEIVLACAIQNRRIDFVWEKSSKIIDSARWSDQKSIDYKYLDYISSVDFLFIDDIDLVQTSGNHRHPPDITSLDNLFLYRLKNKLPTIITCSDRFYNSRERKVQLGNEFSNLISQQDNFVVNLKRRNNDSR